MKRINPLVSIAGVAFAIDVFHEEFIDVSEPVNRFSFGNLLLGEKGYVILFDTVKSGVWNGKPSDLPDHVTVAVIPPIVKIDPVGLYTRLKRPLSYLKKLESDSGWLSDHVASSLKNIGKWTGS